MLNSLLDRVWMFPALCRDRVAGLWYRWDTYHMVIVGVTGAFVAAIAFIVHFAYTGHVQRQADQQRRTDLRCLAENVYHEARGEPRAGQYAVAEVTMNRVASPRFPGSVCAVVHQSGRDAVSRRQVAAFSWTMQGMPSPGGRAWEQAMEVAVRVYDGEQPPLVPRALHYHASRIEPGWARAKTPLETIGNHIFYP